MQEFIQHPEDVRHFICAYPHHSVEYSCAQIYVCVTHCSTQVSGGYILLKDRLNAKQTKWNTGSGVGYTADPSGAVPGDGALSMGNRGCCLSTLPERWERCVHRKGRGDTRHSPDCGEGEAICSQFTADCGQTGSPRENQEGSGCCNSIMSCSHTGPFAEGVLLSYKIVINAKFLSLFSLWLGFTTEIKDRR